MKRILIIGSQHGNELLGEQLYAYSMQQPPSDNLCIEYLLANPRAYRAQVRYIESDLNRSFSKSGETYEQRLATRLLRRLRRVLYDLVIDAHTTNVQQAPCIIVPQITDHNRAYLSASHIEIVVVMRHGFINHSLIGNVPNSVSLELSTTDITQPMMHLLYDDLLAYATDRQPFPTKSVFTVDGLIEKSSIDQEARRSLQNFAWSTAGFYPVLVGENSYKTQTNYLGFKASTKQTITL